MQGVKKMKKIDKLMSLAEDYLSTENRKRKEKIKCLKHVLKKLRKREDKLDAKFEEGRGNKDKISKELAMIHAHRKKGIELLKTHKKALKKLKKHKNCDVENSDKNPSSS